MGQGFDKAVANYYKENDVTLPSFAQWASYVHVEDDQRAIQQAIEQAYAKGLAAGYQAGLKEGDKWWEQQDKEAILQEITDLGQLQDEATGPEVTIPLKHTGD